MTTKCCWKAHCSSQTWSWQVRNTPAAMSFHTPACQSGSCQMMPSWHLHREHADLTMFAISMLAHMLVEIPVAQLSTHSLRTAYTILYTLYTPCTYPIHTLHSLCTHSTHTLYTLYTHPIHTLHTLCTHPAHSLHTPYIHTQYMCSHPTHSLHMCVCPPHTPYPLHSPCTPCTCAQPYSCHVHGPMITKQAHLVLHAKSILCVLS